MTLLSRGRLTVFSQFYLSDHDTKKAVVSEEKPDYIP